MKSGFNNWYQDGSIWKVNQNQVGFKLERDSPQTAIIVELCSSIAQKTIAERNKGI